MTTARVLVSIVSATALALSCCEHLYAELVFYAESGSDDRVSRFSTADESSLTIAEHPNSDPSTVAVDHVNRRVFYSYGTTLAVTGFDGTGRADILAVGNGISALELDSANGHLYFATTSGTLAERTIKRVNTDGSGLTTIHTHDSLGDDPYITTSEVHNIIVDADSDRLHWTADDGGVAGRIGLNFSTLSGSGVGQHWRSTGRSSSISKMDIDLDEGTLYYTVGSTADEVRRSSLDNSGMETLVSGIGEPYALDVDFAEDRLNFVIGGDLYQGNLDGTGLESYSLGSSSLFNVRDLEVSVTAIPESKTFFLLATAIAGLVGRRLRDAIRT